MAGYLQVHLSKENVLATKKVHRLVAIAFIGAPPIGSDEVNHIDFNKKNNRLNNLEWSNRKHNHTHALVGGRLDAVVSIKRAKKMTVEKVLALRLANETEGVGSRVLARRFDIAPQTAQKIIDRKIWKRI